MKTKLLLLFIMLAFLAGIHQAAAQGMRFFRIAGPAATTITAFNLDGTLIWSNAQPGATYTIQTISALPGETNWVDYVQIPTTNGVNTNLLIDFNPPAGVALIPAGSFTMGDALDGESDAVPTVTANVSAFYMDVNLVSYSQWRSVYLWAKTNGYFFDNAGSGKADDHPAQTINWFDTVKWCNARSEKEGRVPAYYTSAAQTVVYRSGQVAVRTNWVNWSSGYRLPTEAEWEKAARGGLSGQRFPWGNVISQSLANYQGNTHDFSYDLVPNGYNATFADNSFTWTSPVGYFAPNGYGLYDMAGNVFEWCWDWYGTPYAGGTDPRGHASGTYRGLRGGHFLGYAYIARCADHNSGVPTLAFDIIGFRCVRGL